MPNPFVPAKKDEKQEKQTVADAMYFTPEGPDNLIFRLKGKSYSVNKDRLYEVTDKKHQQAFQHFVERGLIKPYVEEKKD